MIQAKIGGIRMKFDFSPTPCLQPAYPMLIAKVYPMLSIAPGERGGGVDSSAMTIN